MTATDTPGSALERTPAWNASRMIAHNRRSTSAIDWVEQIRGIALDLTSIEVNTIEAECMTGRKMPSWPLALLDVARKYADFLTGPRVNLKLDEFAKAFSNLSYRNMEYRPASNTVLTGPQGFVHHESTNRDGVDPAVLLNDFKELEAHRDGSACHDLQLTNGPETFLCLQWAARNVLPQLAVAQGAPKSEQVEMETTRVIVQRIQRNCEQLRGMSRTLLRLARDEGAGTLQKADGLLATAPVADKGERIGFTRQELELVDIGGETVPKAPAELLNRLRKAWDIGTDRIVLQTVIQLDGDAIYRASRDMLDPRHYAVAQAHERITGIALSHWHGLFTLVTGLLTGRRGRVLGNSFKDGG